MLGYELEDLNKMIKAIGEAITTQKSEEIKADLYKARDLLEGLWAEGYFD